VLGGRVTVTDCSRSVPSVGRPAPRRSPCLDPTAPCIYPSLILSRIFKLTALLSPFIFLVGDKRPKPARWIGSDALRELTSPAVRARLKG
jgi:hypothetical protein